MKNCSVHGASMVGNERSCRRCGMLLPEGASVYNLRDLGLPLAHRNHEGSDFACARCAKEYYKPRFPDKFQNID